jgi:hypothetical protein
VTTATAELAPRRVGSASGRRGRIDALVRPHRRLNLVFFATLAVMAAHEAEHVAQIVQKDALGNACPVDCRGLLGFIFDVEWIHFAYNTSLFLALAVLFLVYGMWRREWRRAAPAPWAAFAFGVFAIQGYHVVEHAVKIDQWFAAGRKSPTPGILGQELGPPVGHELSLIELHFALNTAVFAAVAVGYFGFRFHRHVLPARPRFAAVPAPMVVALIAAPVALTWAAEPPTVRLAAGVHQGPLLLDTPQKLVGEPGAIVRGGIRITADGVVVRGVRVVGGENGIEVERAQDVVLEDVVVSGSELDGIHVRMARVSILDCRIGPLAGEYTQGIDLSFGFHRGQSLVRGCEVHGGREGIVANSVIARVARNRVTGTTLRAISINEMSTASVERNVVTGAVGVGIFCNDYSHCAIERNVVQGTVPDPHSDDGSRRGYAIQAQFYAVASLEDNRLVDNARRFSSFGEAKLEHE